MNISELARVTQTTTDTIRYYEKQGLLGTPKRQENGYRFYNDDDVRHVRFIRSSQTLGFSLSEIKAIMPDVLDGKFGRMEIEKRLAVKIDQIDQKITALHAIRKELTDTFSQLTCPVDTSLSIDAVTR